MRRRNGLDELRAASPRQPAGRVEVPVRRLVPELLRRRIVLGVDQQPVELCVARNLGKHPHVADGARPRSVVVPCQPVGRCPERAEITMRKPGLAVQRAQSGDLVRERLLRPRRIGEDRGEVQLASVRQLCAKRKRDAVKACLRQLVRVAGYFHRRYGEQVPSMPDQPFLRRGTGREADRRQAAGASCQYGFRSNLLGDSHGSLSFD